MEQLIGSIAAFLTTTAFLPQTIKVIRTRDTRSISLAMYATFSAGVFLWLIYGLMLMSWPIIVANCVTLVLSLTILAMKIRLG
ncbi:MAG: SemiSWEET transporter [Alphaproteobacteria bacterium]|nr:SemiSWEET transporter [Alphaproteobacteria bacterium]